MNKNLSQATTLLCLGSLAMVSCNNSSIKRPNIVVILTDDMGYGDVSKFNPDSKVQTPNMDALAESGVWCSDVHSASSVSSPSRYSLLTGRYPWRGVLTRGTVDVCEDSAIEDDLYTLPKMLKDCGYNTACIGKWHLGFDWPWRSGSMPSESVRRTNFTLDLIDWDKPTKGGPLGAGFDYYFGDDCPNFPPYAFIENNRLTCTPVIVDPVQFKTKGDKGGFRGAGPGQQDWDINAVMPTITRKAVNYIEQKSKEEKPFFLFFTTTSPHTPVVPADEFDGRSESGAYGDYVVQTDDAVGQVIDALKREGQFDNTLLIVSSDNGPSPIILHVIKDYDHKPAMDLRGMKFGNWEGGHRIPFIASWPDGGVKGGKKQDALFSLVDLFGTIADIVGVEFTDEQGVDSYNVMESIKNGKSVRPELVTISHSGMFGLRKDNWVYLEESGGRQDPAWRYELLKIESPDAPLQLFNLDEDLGQKKNVFEDHPEILSQMRVRLSEIKNSSISRK